MTDQPDLPGMPEDSEIVKTAKGFVRQKQLISEAKLRLEIIEKDILKQMEKDGLSHFKIIDGGENYEFELVESERSIRCAKITKTVKPSKAEAAVQEPASA